MAYSTTSHIKTKSEQIICLSMASPGLFFIIKRINGITYSLKIIRRSLKQTILIYNMKNFKGTFQVPTWEKKFHVQIENTFCNFQQEKAPKHALKKL